MKSRWDGWGSSRQSPAASSRAPAAPRAPAAAPPRACSRARPAPATRACRATALAVSNFESSCTATQLRSARRDVRACNVASGSSHLTGSGATGACQGADMAVVSASRPSCATSSIGVRSGSGGGTCTGSGSGGGSGGGSGSSSGGTTMSCCSRAPPSACYTCIESACAAQLSASRPAQRVHRLRLPGGVYNASASPAASRRHGPELHERASRARDLRGGRAARARARRRSPTAAR